MLVRIVRAHEWTITIFYDKWLRKSRKMSAVFQPRMNPMQHKISRRALVKGGLIAGAVIPTLGLMTQSAAAAGLPPLDPKDPTAQSLGFVLDASKVNATANPTYKPTQKCGTCAQYQGKAGDASGGCNIFAGKSVPVGGWCKVWAQKPGAS
jgi:hypothetical protein